MRKNNFSKIILFGLINLIFVACKKPQAEFNLKKYEYAAGDIIIYENLSTNYKSAKWRIFGDEIDNLYIGRNPNLLINILSPDGVYKLKLTVSNNNKESSSEKKFLVKCKRGLLKINTSGSNFNSQKAYHVYIDDQYVGEATNYSWQNQIPEGIRIITLNSSSKTLTKVVEIKNGSSVSILF
jgi:hypothetical protein